MNSPAMSEAVSAHEILRQAAEDAEFYGHFFFPKTYRQPSPGFVADLNAALDSPDCRHISAAIFRGSAKTSRLRVYTSKRIAFGISRTILFVGKSQESAMRSVKWLKKQVEFNKLWAGVFGLRKGATWSEHEIEILHGPEGISITVIALGITGSTRGVNVDDYRPDLIVVDDPCDEENTATAEQREKISDLFFGSLDKSLAPRSEAPLAKMVLLQTVLNADDLVSKTFDDPQWTSFRISCFDGKGESTWPERFPTEELRQDKHSHILRGMLSLWMREMESVVTSRETSSFNTGLVKFWDVLPEGGIKIISVDPTPPPKDLTVQKPAGKLDDAVIGVLQVVGKNVYVCEIWSQQAPDDEELLEMIFEMWMRWRPLHKICIETILFARLFKTALERKMREKKMFLQVQAVEDKRSKQARIRQEVSSALAHGNLYIHPSQTKLLEQLTAYPNVKHDDHIDMLSLGIFSIEHWMYSDNEGDVIEGVYEELFDLPELPNWRGVP